VCTMVIARVILPGAVVFVMRSFLVTAWSGP
jgi:hypothetical protein